MFEGEQGKGVFGYLIASIVAYVLNIIFSTYTTLTITQSTFLSIYIIGNILIYSSDILFAKERFPLPPSHRVTLVPYSDLSTRASWLLHSLYQKYFFRFLITVVIDTMVGLTLLRLILQKLDSLNILTKWKYRNFVVAWGVAALTYLLYLSTLRFQWAYQYQENPLMNILVMAWLSLALLISATGVTMEQKKEGETPKWRGIYG